MRTLYMLSLGLAAAVAGCAEQPHSIVKSADQSSAVECPSSSNRRVTIKTITDTGENWAAYPTGSAAARSGGSVKVKCDISPEGVPMMCIASDEKPAGLGFGEAALKLEYQWRFNPEFVCGKSVKSVFWNTYTFSPRE